MKGEPLPNGEVAVVARGKLVDYLLSEAHPDGRGKARFFNGHGFSALDWEALAATLRAHATRHGVVESAATVFRGPVYCRWRVGSTGRSPARRTRGVVHSEGSGRAGTGHSVSCEAEVVT